MDLALNTLQRLICHKTQQTNQPSKGPKFCKCESDREMEDVSTDQWKTATLTPFQPTLIPHSGLQSISATKQGGQLPPLEWCPGQLTVTLCDWLHSVSDRGYLCIYIISSRPYFLVVNPRELLTLKHHLFSDNHFIYTASTSCPINPWLMALSKVNMQQIETCVWPFTKNARFPQHSSSKTHQVLND